VVVDVLWAPQTPLALAACVAAGLVYGFAGFGAALVAVPALAALYSPADAVGIFALSALASLVTVVPRAWREADRPAVAQLLVGAAVTLPIGLYVLRTAPTEVLRWAISLVVLGTVAALAAPNERRAGVRMRRCTECPHVMPLHVQVCARCGADLPFPAPAPERAARQERLFES